jgi:serine protease Do
VRLALVVAGVVVSSSTVSFAEGEPPYCAGEYADDLGSLKPQARDLERQPYSFCVRNTAVYECLSYGDDGTIKRTRKRAVMHGTAFGYKQQNGETLLLTNEHVAEWPAVTEDARSVDGVPPGCKRVSETLRIVDNEDDHYEADDVALSRVVVDPQLDAAVLKARTTLPVLPWKIGRSASLRERNVVEVRGFPLGAFQATNVGKVVNAWEHDDERDWDHDDFVIDALLSAGNSGSPVLAVSCKTGEYELVGLFHAGYTQGSALNVVVGIDQVRELMTTLKRTPRSHGELVATLDAGARGGVAREPGGAEPFFPFGSLAAVVRPRSDGALVFEVFSREFPFRTTPLFAFEDLRSPSGFGELGRLWFGSASAGLKGYVRSDLDADAQALVGRVVDALRRDALGFFGWRDQSANVAPGRDAFDQLARTERSLSRTVTARRDVAAQLADLADRLSPRPGEPASPVAVVFQAPSPPPQPPAPAASTAPVPLPPTEARRVTAGP